jgi:hypothetical protein
MPAGDVFSLHHTTSNTKSLCSTTANAFEFFIYLILYGGLSEGNGGTCNRDRAMTLVPTCTEADKHLIDKFQLSWIHICSEAPSCCWDHSLAARSLSILGCNVKRCTTQTIGNGMAGLFRFQYDNDQMACVFSLVEMQPEHPSSQIG